MMTRADHLEWAKARANEYLDQCDIAGAMASLISDLDKHPDLKDHRATKLMMTLMLMGQLKSVDEVRLYINGFN